jgi:hypothetical protein
MPTAVLDWYEPEHARGRVSRRGREYPVRGDVERDAQVPKARVRFDIGRHEGVEWAENVRLRRGTRVAGLQHRFGDLVGRRSHGTRESTPRAVGELWLAALEAGDAGLVKRLYTLNATLRWGGTAALGRERIWRLLEARLAPRPRQDRELTSVDEHTVELVWGEPPTAPRTIRMRVARGEIVEQWIGD